MNELEIIETFDLTAMDDDTIIKNLDCGFCFSALRRERFAVRVWDDTKETSCYCHQSCAQQRGAKSK